MTLNMRDKFLEQAKQLKQGETVQVRYVDHGDVADAVPVYISDGLPGRKPVSVSIPFNGTPENTIPVYFAEYDPDNPKTVIPVSVPG